MRHFYLGFAAAIVLFAASFSLPAEAMMPSASAAGVHAAVRGSTAITDVACGYHKVCNRRLGCSARWVCNTPSRSRPQPQQQSWRQQ